MTNIIKISKDYEIGEILAKVAQSEGDITLQVSSDSDFTNNKQDVDTIKKFARSKNKNVSIQSSERFEKVGFVAGEDVTQKGPAPAPQIKKEEAKKTSKKPKMPKMKFGKKTPTILIIILILFVVGGIYGFSTLAYKLPKAEVSLTVDPEIFTGSKDYLGTTEPGENEIRIYTQQVEVIGDMKAVATGEKETGEKATGEIELLNKSDDEIEVDSGTTVTINYNGEDINFVTTEDVKIEGKSEKEVEDDGETVKAEVYGSSKVEIEAAEPGDKYNISNDDIESENISIDSDDSDDLDVELSKSTTGGLSEKSTVVSEKDLTDLRDRLQDKLENEAKDKINQELSESQQLLEGSVNSTVSNVTYSAEAEEEVGEIEASMTLSVQSYYIDNNSIRESLDGEIESLVPDNYKVSEIADNISIVSSVKEINTNAETGAVESVDISTKIQITVIPNIEESKLKEDLSGISLSKAKEYLSGIPNIIEADINQKPSRIFANTLPKNKDNITIVVTASSSE